MAIEKINTKEFDIEDEEKLIKFTNILKELDFKIKNGDYNFLHYKHKGIRNTQVGALLFYLIEKGIL